MKRLISSIMAIILTVSVSLPLAYASNPSSGFTANSVSGASIFVSPSGNDSNPGTIDQPLKTVTAARNKVRTMNDNMSSDITVYLRAGTYYQEQTLTFTKEDSATNGFTITYTPYNNELVTISGGRELTGWTLFDAGKGIYKASFGSPVDTRELYVNGNVATRARSVGGLQGGASDKAKGAYTTDMSMLNWKNQSSMELVFFSLWTSPRTIVDHISVDPNNASRLLLTMSQPGWTNATNKGASSASGAPKWIENAYELLDSPGEWYLDKTGAIGGDAYSFYYKPLDGEEMSSAKVVVPVLETLMKIESDNIDQPVRDITFAGITFSDATWLRPNTFGIADAQNNYTREDGDRATGGNIYLNATQHIVFDSCEFKQFGNAAVYMHQGNKDNLIVGSHFYNIGAQAIQIGDVDLRDPKNFYLPHTAWAGNPAYPAYTAADWDFRYVQSNNDIINNTIHDIGLQYFSAAAIGAATITETDVSHNEIFNIPYAGLHMGYGWGMWSNLTGSPMGNNRYQYNYIHDCMEVLIDAGAIYTLGSQSQASGAGGWAKPTIISDNYILDQKNLYGSLYFDEGSNYYDVYNNVIQNTPKFILVKHVQNKIHNNYSNQTSVSSSASPNEPGTASILDNTYVTGSNYPPEALEIMKNAGVQENYRHSRFDCPLVHGELRVSDSADKDYPLAIKTSKLADVKNDDFVQLYIEGSGLAGKQISVKWYGQVVSGIADSQGKVYLGVPRKLQEIPELLTDDGLTVYSNLPRQIDNSVIGKLTYKIGWEKVISGVKHPLISTAWTYYVLYDVYKSDLNKYDFGQVTQSSNNPDNATVTFDAAKAKIEVVDDGTGSGEKALKLSKTGAASVNTGFKVPVPTNPSDLIEVSADVKQPNSDVIAYTLNPLSGTNQMAQAFHNKGQIAYYPVGSGTLSNVLPYPVNEWHNLKIIMDTQKQTYDIYVNGLMYAQGLAFSTAINMNTLTDITIGQARFDATATGFYIKNIAVRTSAPARANKAQLQAKITAAQSLVPTDYTAGTWANLSSALANAQNVNSNQNATQIEVESATATLNNAINGLVMAAIVDKTALETAITSAITFQKTNWKGYYVLASWDAFTNAISSAKNIDKNASARQSDVNNALANLQSAQSNLVVTDTPYTGFELDLKKYQLGAVTSTTNNPDGATIVSTASDKISIFEETTGGPRDIKFTKTTTSGTGSGTSIDFPIAVSGNKMEVSFNAKASANTSFVAYNTVISGAYQLAQTNFNNTSKFAYFKPGAGTQTDTTKTYAANTWYNIRMVIDTGSKKYDSYVDGQKVISAADYPTSGYTGTSITKVSLLLNKFTAGTKDYYVKDLKVKTSSVLDADKVAYQQSLDTALATNPQADYTPETWAPFKQAWDDAANLTSLINIPQADAGLALQKLEIATSELISVLLANKTALQTAISDLATLNPSDYTTASWTAYQNAVTNGQSVNANSNALQSEVDAATAAINTAKAGLQRLANKTALLAAIAEASTFTASNYTTSSWAMYQTAISNGRLVADDPSATQAEADAKVTAINSTKSALVPAANKTALIAALNAIPARTQSDYTPASWEAFATAIAYATTVKNDGDAKPAVISFKVSELNRTQSSLLLVANRTSLQASISNAGSLLNNLYTPVTLLPFQKALADAKYVNRNLNATQQQVDHATASLDNSILSLVIIVPQDMTPPVTTDNAPKDWTNHDVSVSLTATDTESGVADTFFTLDGSTAQSGKSVAINSEGLHVLTYWSVDKVGNMEAPHMVTINIDKSSPVSSAIVSGNSGANGWYTENPTVTLATYDLLSGVGGTQYRINNGSWESYVEPFTITEEGLTTLEYRGIDLAGNTEVTNTSIIKLDKTAPTLNVVLDQTRLWPANNKLVSVNATVTANDDISQLASVVLQTITGNEPDNNAIQDAEFGTYDTIFSLRAERLGQGTDRTYTITYVATDQAGNQATAQATVIVPHDQRDK